MRLTAQFATVVLLFVCAAGPAARARDNRKIVPPPVDRPTAESLASLDTGLGIHPAAKAGMPGANVAAGGPLPSGAGTGGGDVREQEPNDTFADADPARDVPFEAYGKINDGDVDTFSFDAAAGEHYNVVLFSHGIGATLDPYLTVTGPDLVSDVSLDDNNYPADLDATIYYTVSMSGSQYVSVSQSPNTTIGADGYYAVWVYRTDGIDVAFEQEPNDDPNEADQVGLPGYYRGVIGEAGDTDFVQFVGRGGSTIVVDVNAAIFRSGADIAVALFDADGRPLFFNDFESPLETDPLFNLVLPADGVYNLAIQDHNDGAPEHFYYVTITEQDGAASPKITNAKIKGVSGLKKVVGNGFHEGAVVEIFGRVVGSFFTVKPTQIKIKPPAELQNGAVVTVLNPDGRRSNPFVRESSGPE